MSRLHWMVSAPRLLGLAPFSCTYTPGPVPDDALPSFSAHKGWAASSAALLLLLGVTTCVLSILPLRHQYHAGVVRVALSFTTLYFAVGIVLFCVYLWRRQWRGLAPLLNSPHFRQAAISTSVWPAVAATTIKLVLNEGLFLFIDLWSGDCHLYRESCTLISYTPVTFLWMLVYMAEECLFTFLVGCLVTHAEQLVRELEDLVPPGAILVTPKEPDNALVAAAREMRVKFAELQDLTYAVSFNFGPQMFIIFTTVMWYTVCLLFLTVTSTSLAEAAYSFVEFLGDVLSQGLIVLVADSLPSTIEKVHQLVRDIVNSPHTSEEMKAEVKELLLQLSYSPLVVRVSGNVELKSNLLLQATTTVSMYILILLQFYTSLGS